MSNNYTTLISKYTNSRELYNSSSRDKQELYEDFFISISSLVKLLEEYNLLLSNSSEDFKISFNQLITFLLEMIDIFYSNIISGCTMNKYILTLGSNLDSIVYKPDITTFPDSYECPIIKVLVPVKNEDGTYKIINSYDATEGVLNSSIDMEIMEGQTLDTTNENIVILFQSIIKKILGEVNITEFTVTGQNDRPLLNYNSSVNSAQPITTYAYGIYDKLDYFIKDKNIKLKMKIYNPSKSFKITHLTNIPQTYTF